MNIARVQIFHKKKNIKYDTTRQVGHVAYFNVPGHHSLHHSIGEKTSVIHLHLHLKPLIPHPINAASNYKLQEVNISEAVLLNSANF